MKRKYKILLIVVSVFITFIGISFSFFSIGSNQGTANVIISGCLSITIDSESNSLNLTNTYPITDIQGLKNQPYTFTIKNNCDKSTSYGIYLENVNKNNDTLLSNYVKVSLLSDTNDNLISLLASNEKVSPSITNAYEAFSLYKGTIDANATKTFELREWVDFNTTKEQGANKTFFNKISVIANPDLKVDSTPEIKFSIEDSKAIGYISDNKALTKYCTSKNNICIPNINANIIDNKIEIEVEENINQIVCVSLNDNKTICSNPIFIENGINILASINGNITNNFPTKNDNYRPVNVNCTNKAKGKFDYIKWSVMVDVVSATTCTVDFEQNLNVNFVQYLANKVCNNTPKNDDEAKSCLVNENGLRYQGSNPNNYVLFNDELWRIIGVFNTTNSSGITENLVKIMKYDMLDGLTFDLSSNNNWHTTSLQEELNGGYLNLQDITCYGSLTTAKICRFSESGIKELERKMIENVVWNLGGLSTKETDENYYATTTENYYKYERKNLIYAGNETLWTGKVGLMYPSDYGFGVLASNCPRTTLLTEYNTTNCAGNNWIYKDVLHWTMTPASDTAQIFQTGHGGNLFLAKSTVNRNVHPVVYLKSSVNLNNGNGSINSPYIIS